MKAFTELTARIFLGQIFLIAGIGKVAAFAGTQSYMAAMGVPGALLPLVILLEIGGGLAIMVGWRTQWVSIALALFTIATAVIFHRNLADQIQQIMFMKNIAITGGFLLLAAHGAGAYSLDKRGNASNTL